MTVRGVGQPVITVDADSGSVLLPKTYVTRHGRLVLYADDPLARAMKSQRAADAAADAVVEEKLRKTFNGNMLYLAASVLVFGDKVCSIYPNTAYRGV